MRLLIGEEEVSFSSKELSNMYIDCGLEGEVYRYGDKALKLYWKKQYKRRLEEETASELINISTKRILLPRELIRDAETLEFKGYETQFIESFSSKKIKKMQMDKFLDEISLIEEDIRVLSENNVELYDFTMSNFLYNGGIYFCDPGSFSIDEVSSNKNNYPMNTFKFNKFIFENIFGMYLCSKALKRREYYKNYDWNEPLSEQMRVNSLPCETVKQHVKRMTR